MLRFTPDAVKQFIGYAIAWSIPRLVDFSKTVMDHTRTKAYYRSRNAWTLIPRLVVFTLKINFKLMRSRDLQLIVRSHARYHQFTDRAYLS